MTESAAILAAVRALGEQLAQLRAELAQHAVARPCALSRADAELLSILLPRIAGAVGSAGFRASDLLDDDFGVRHLLNDRTAKAIGKLLARSENVPFGGYVAQRCEPPRGFWHILRVE